MMHKATVGLFVFSLTICFSAAFAKTPSEKEKQDSADARAQSFCTAWNSKPYVQNPCIAKSGAVSFTVDRKDLIGFYKPEDLPAAEYQSLAPLLAYLWDGKAQLNPEVKVIAQTADGYCRETSKSFLESVKNSAEQTWKASETGGNFEDYWLRNLWEAAPKTQCAAGSAKIYPALKPHYTTAPKSPADRACRLVMNLSREKTCLIVNDTAIQYSDARVKIMPEAEATKATEFVELSPTLLNYWPVSEYKGVERSYARLANGKCKTITNQEGLNLENKWETIRLKNKTISGQDWRTAWYKDGWNRPEVECPLTGSSATTQ